MLRISFERFEFTFECALEWLKSLSKGSNLDLKALNLFRICIRMLQIPFEWFEFGFESFESLSNDSNLHSNASNPFRMVRISI